ncbi:GATA zinc finger domain-containing protein 21-like [Protopterus annectens]|uniref:GATA zinc finger domain-containing protein 21-like n=1 Tax=Protopterus annectens TaxID=7888 RepID=UPI001CFBF889|nr:GATA zinc finger domain-containing protein 21-like [Protopterus annectens]
MNKLLSNKKRKIDRDIKEYANKKAYPLPPIVSNMNIPQGSLNHGTDLTTESNDPRGHNSNTQSPLPCSSEKIRNNNTQGQGPYYDRRNNNNDDQNNANNDQGFRRGNGLRHNNLESNKNQRQRKNRKTQRRR